MRFRTLAASAALLLWGLVMAVPAPAKIPEPPFTLYGALMVDGVAPVSGTVWCTLPGGQEHLAEFLIGADPNTAGTYALRLPMDSVLPHDPGTVEAGAEVQVWVNGLPAARVMVEEKGSFRLLNLNASSLHEIRFLSGPAGTPNPVSSGETVLVSAESSDSQEHPVRYHWGASCPGLPSSGAFAETAAASTSWTAPRNATGNPVVCTLRVTADDGLGLAAWRSYSQTVNSIPDSISLLAGPDGAPNPAASEGTVSLSVSAQDSLGHGLSYTWSAVCPGFDSSGSFSGNGMANALWMAPGNRADVRRDCTIMVEAGHGSSVKAQGFYIQGVEPALHGLSIVQNVVAVPNPVVSGTEASLSVVVADSRDHQFSYSWSAVCQAVGGNGSFSDRAVRAPVWTAPLMAVNTRQDCTLRVTVDDGHGLATVSTAMVNVLGGGPVAVLKASPNPAACPQETTFDGSDSHHQNPARRIAAYEWDFHYDGVTFRREATGSTASLIYGEVGPHTVALRVSDDSVPPVSSIDSLEVMVDGKPPEAVAGGPYVISAGDSLMLDGGESSDPDTGCGDAAVDFSWDLNGDGAFGDAQGRRVSLSWPEIRDRVCGGSCRESASYPLSLRVTDSLGYQDAAEAVLWINPMSVAVKLVSPNGGEMYGNGESRTISWLSGGAIDTVNLMVSPDGRGGWRTVLRGISAGEGSAVWTVPAWFVSTMRNCRMKVVGVSGGREAGADLGDAPFAMGPVDLVFPEAGAVVEGGRGTTVTWRQFRTAGDVVWARLRFTLDGGRTWQETRRSPAGGGGYFWDVPLVASRKEHCRVQVLLQDAGGSLVGRDTGQGEFTILGAVDLTGPDRGDEVYGGTSRLITWKTYTLGRIASVLIIYSTDGGRSWRRAGAVKGNPGFFAWRVPVIDKETKDCWLKVLLKNIRGKVIAQDTSHGRFTLLPLP